MGDRGGAGARDQRRLPGRGQVLGDRHEVPLPGPRLALELDVLTPLHRCAEHHRRPPPPTSPAPLHRQPRTTMRRSLIPLATAAALLLLLFTDRADPTA